MIIAPPRSTTFIVALGGDTVGGAPEHFLRIMFDGSFFQIGSDDFVYQATLFAAAAILLLTGLVAVMATMYHIRSDRKARRYAALESEWESLVDELLGGATEKIDLGAHMDPPERLQFLRFLLRATPGRPPREADLLKRVAEPYLDVARTGGRFEAPEIRAGRIQILGWLGGPDDVPQIVRALDDTSPLVALVALRALVRRRESQTIDKIVARLDRFRFWNMRTIASLLSEFGPAIVAPLRARVVDPTADRRIRLIGMTTLQQIGGDMAEDTAVEILEQSTDRGLITGALRILEASGEARNLALLRELADSEDEIVRLRAYAALSAIGAKSEIATLESALDDRNAWVAMRAAEALIRAGRFEALERAATGTSARAALARQVLSEQRRLRG